MFTEFWGLPFGQGFIFLLSLLACHHIVRVHYIRSRALGKIARSVVKSSCTKCCGSDILGGREACINHKHVGYHIPHTEPQCDY